MSTPFDKAFRLFAEDEDLGLLRVVAKMPIPADARIEHLDRDLDLATLHVDHLYRITSATRTTAVHMEAFSLYDSDWRRRHGRYSALIWVKYELNLVSYMFLLTDRGVPKDIEESFELDAGDLTLRMRVRVIRMWEVPARDLLATGDPAILAWVPLTDAAPDELLRAAGVVSGSRDPELSIRMALLHGMRYGGNEVLEPMLTEEMVKESSFYQRILGKGEAKGRLEGRVEGRLEGKREILRGLCVKKFGRLPEFAEERLRQATEEDLDRWIVRLLSATSIDEMFS